jgi:hypothetical protein
MTVAEFWQQLYENTTLPFEYEEIVTVEFISGIPFVRLINEDVYAFTPQLLENKISEDTSQ